MPAVDTAVPSLARAYDYLIGGRANFAADRALAGRLQTLYPRMPEILSSSRTYTSTAVARLAQRGIAQFVDIGCGLPTRPSVHQAALGARPDARVVYVDRDPAVVAHAAGLVPHARPPAAVRVIEGDLSEPEALLWVLREMLDLSQPACLVLALVVQALPDLASACAVIGVLVRALAPGSHVVMTAAGGAEGRLPDALAGAALTAGDMESLLAGLELAPPGPVEGLLLSAAGRKP
jgi:hypothetical protein